jgi:hypothetical protein
VIQVVTPVVRETPLPLAALEFDDFARVVPGQDPRPPARRRFLTKLSDDQAAYTGVPVAGPYKPDHHHY